MNLFIVFFITGFWHGASWTFIVWGLIHGVFMVIEKLGFGEVLKRIWTPLQHIYVLLVVSMSWVVFRADSFEYAMGFYNSLFVYKASSINADMLMSFTNLETYIVFVLAFLGSTRVFEIIIEKFRAYSHDLSLSRKNTLIFIADLSETIAIVLVLFLSTMYLVAGTYNPFIYFRF